MEKSIIITMTIDTETAFVTDLDVSEAGYNRTECVLEGVDDPVSVNTAMRFIRDDIISRIKK